MKQTIRAMSSTTNTQPNMLVRELKFWLTNLSTLRRFAASFCKQAARPWLLDQLVSGLSGGRSLKPVAVGFLMAPRRHHPKGGLSLGRTNASNHLYPCLGMSPLESLPAVGIAQALPRLENNFDHLFGPTTPSPLCSVGNEGMTL